MIINIKGGKTEKLENTENYLSFIEKFEGRVIKDGYDWNKDIYENLEKFLLMMIYYFIKFRLANDKIVGKVQLDSVANQMIF